MKKIIRNVQKYNSILAEIKAVMAAEELKYYKITECTNSYLYGGVECYTQYASGAYTNRSEEVFSTVFENTVGTISSEGCYYEEQINKISKDVALRAIKLGMKEAFKAPQFVGNDDQCPENDDGVWWNNHRMVPSCTVVEVNDHKWTIYYQD